MTKEEFEVLSKYDDKFESVAAGAKHIKYVSLAMRNECAPIYKSLFGRVISKGEWNCPHCAFNIYKQIALEYVKYKREISTVQEEAPAEDSTVQEEVKITKRKYTKRNGTKE